MTSEELLISRRSIRKYKAIGVPSEITEDMIEESTFAPNAGNAQPWKFIVVNDRHWLKKISDESKKNIRARIAADPDDYAPKYKGMLENKSLLHLKGESR